MCSLAKDIGIDLGTASVLVYVKGKGVVLKEPSVVAIDKVRNKVLAVGDDAREMLGRAPGSIVAIRPLKEGVIANYTVTQKLLAYVIEKVAGKSLFFKPRVMTCVPIGITSVEKRAVMEATTQGGASKTYLIEEPLAAALGAGIDISVPRGNMVVDIGGGTTGIAVVQKGQVVYSGDEPSGGRHVSLTIAGGEKITLEAAEQLKIAKGKQVWPMVRPVFEKMADIVRAHIQGHEVRTLYLSGGSCSLAGVGELFADEFPELEIVLPKHPIFLTPFAIAAYQTHATNAGAQQ